MKIGLVGCGKWGRLILRDLCQLGAKVHVTAQTEKTCNIALNNGATGASVTLDIGVKVDGYVVAVPTKRHFNVISQLIPSGKPIFCEKPMTADPAEMDLILAQAPDQVFSMDKWRYHLGVLKLAELAQSGALGNIASVCTYRLGWAHTPSDVDVAWHLAPHDLSIALEILGYLPPVKSAVGLNVSPTLQSLQAVLQDPSGGPQVQLDVSSAHPVNRRSVTIIGSTGLAALGGSYDKHIVLMPKAGEPEHISIEQKMPLLAELDTFLKHLAGGPPPKSTAREAAIIISRLSEIRCLAGFE